MTAGIETVELDVGHMRHPGQRVIAEGGRCPGPRDRGAGQPRADLVVFEDVLAAVVGDEWVTESLREDENVQEKEGADGEERGFRPRQQAGIIRPRDCGIRLVRARATTPRDLSRSAERGVEL